MQEKKTLTFVVPAYNMTEYLERCVESLIASKRNDDIEVLIVDDGSSDGTLEMAKTFEARNPGIVRAIHQENKGHGGAVNTGIAAASGMYVKVVDADDWVGPESLEQVMAVLRGEVDKDEPLDMLVTNYVYDKVGKRNKHVVNFRHAMEPGKRLTWDDLGHFGLTEYILMHALIYRTAVVRESKMQLPEHTFYVDFIYAYQPFPWVKTLQYRGHAVLPLFHRSRRAERADGRDDPTCGPAAARQPVHGARHPRTGYGARRPVPLYDSFSGDSEFRRERFHDFVARSGELREEEGHVGGYRGVFADDLQGRA